MPRPKQYTTKKAKIQAERAKAARYYEKHRSVILERKRVRDRAQAMEAKKQRLVEESKEIEERKERAKTRRTQIEQNRQKVLKEAKRAVSSSSALWEMRNIENRFNEEIKAKPSVLLDEIAATVFRWYSTRPRPSTSPFTPYYNLFEDILESIERTSDKLVVESGGNDVADKWKHADNLRRKVSRICECLDSMHSAVVEEELIQRHNQKLLLHQDPLFRDALDR
ncbi:hypothetical protein VNI00_000466 [Paramarasmius palmivorus]|uniref:Uncharacterized protein n=1 Tax=Paramarasmius palmivorus TaxID=297713 RepID=A0AAW0E9J8_9AGAR